MDMLTAILGGSVSFVVIGVEGESEDEGREVGEVVPE